MAKPAQRKDGLWYQQIELPPDGSGKRRRKYLYGRTTKDLAAKVRAAQKQIAVMGDMSTTSPSLSRWLARWLDETVEPSVRPKTRANYTHMVELIDAAIGGVHLDALKPSHVRRMLKYVTREHPRADGTVGLSPSTAANALRVLRKALKDARGEGLVMRNVAEDVKAPPNPKAKEPVRYLDADEAAHLLTSVASDPRAAVRWSLALMMGLRQGEVLGLLVDHVNLKAGTLTVEWQLQRLDEAPRNVRHRHVERDYYLTEVKSEAGIRTLPMPEPLWEMMRRYLPGRDRAAFVVWDGPRDARADEREWKRALAAAGLPPLKLHTARHSTMTLLAKQGAPDHVRKRIAGHASIAVTNAIYTHADADDVREAMAGMGAMAPKGIEG